MFGLWACWLLTTLAVGAEPAKPATVRVGELLDRAAAAPNVEEAEQALTGAEQLLQRARTGFDRLGLEFLEVDIKRTRGRVYLMSWQRDQTRSEHRGRAKRLLVEARKQYEELKDKAGERAAQLSRKLAGAQASDNPAYRQTRGYVSRANYSMAWTKYNLGLAGEGTERDAHLTEAIEGFASFTQGGYRNHPIVADCFLGQGLCYYELERYADLIELLEPAKADNTPKVTFKRMTYLRLKCYQKQARHLRLHEAAEAYFGALPEEQKLDSVELGMAVEWARSLAALAGDSEASLYKEFQNRLDQMAKRVYPYGDPWRRELAEAIAKTAGSSLFGCLTKAREHFTAEQYEEVLDVVAKGLRGAGEELTGADEELLGDLRHTRAAAAWNLKRWHEAHVYAAEFVQHHAKDRRASDMCRRALQAGLRALEAKPSPGGPTMDKDLFQRFLTFAAREFPDEPEVRNAGWYHANLLLDGGKFAEAERALQTVKPGSSAYRRAQYGMAVSAFKQAEALVARQKGDTTGSAQLLKRAADAVKRYAELAKTGLPQGEHEVAKATVDVALAAGQCLLDLPKPDHAATLQLLGCVDRIAKTLEDPKYAADRRLALSIEAHVQAGQLESATRRIDALLAANAGRVHAVRAFANIADALEKRYENLVTEGKGADAKRLGERLVRIYGFLHRYVKGSKDQAVAEQEVAIERRLARALERQGRYHEAISHYERVFPKLPTEKAGDVLHGLAIAYERTDQFDAAVERWRTLAKGLAKNSEDWFEARYHLILCHHRAGRVDHARKLLAYLRLQCPKIESEQWRPRFDALERTLAEGDT